VTPPYAILATAVPRKEEEEKKRRRKVEKFTKNSGLRRF